MKKTLIIAGLALMTFACTLENILAKKDGLWQIDQYTAVATIGNDTLLSIDFDNAGTIMFEKDGTGEAIIEILGSSDTTNIDWSTNDDQTILTINFNDGDGPLDFEVLESSDDRQLILHSESDTTLGIVSTSYTQMELVREVQ